MLGAFLVGVVGVLVGGSGAGAGSGLGWRVVPLVGSLVVVPLEGAGPRRTVCRRASVPADGCPILLQGSGFGRNAQEESLMFRVLLRCRYR